MHKRLAASVAVLAVAVPVGSAIAGSGTDRATGGGQILISSDGKGAGDTIAFSARAGSLGQIQYVDRTGGTGVGQTATHGTVTCIEAVGNTAKLAGKFRDGRSFTLLVVDNGEGANASNDTMALQFTDDPTCDREDGDDEGSTDLARGNAQVYDAG